MGGMGLLLLLAFGLRLHRLGEPSLWGDEGLSLLSSSSNDPTAANTRELLFSVL
jgi:hypothetical protein